MHSYSIENSKIFRLKFGLSAKENPRSEWSVVQNIVGTLVLCSVSKVTDFCVDGANHSSFVFYSYLQRSGGFISLMKPITG
jgi:hypothetical protein